MFWQIDYLGSMTSGIARNEKIAANNIANAQTPGYVHQEATFTNVLGRLQNPFENDLSRKMGNIQDSQMFKKPGSHPVDIAEEMFNMQEYSEEYSVVTRRLSSIFSNLRRASQIGR